MRHLRQRGNLQATWKRLHAAKAPTPSTRSIQRGRRIGRGRGDWLWARRGVCAFFAWRVGGAAWRRVHAAGAGEGATARHAQRAGAFAAGSFVALAAVERRWVRSGKTWEWPGGRAGFAGCTGSRR
eukprot:359787-Chlamydomonas_euryale.AAC.6